MKENIQSNKQQSIKNVIGPYENYCDGYKGSAKTGDSGYVLTIHLGVGVSDLDLSHPGSHVLSEINAFDRAEVDNGNIGQINMITVSSFCGPMGMIWGLDIARHPNVRSSNLFNLPSGEGEDDVPVYSIEPLLDATRRLFGTVEQKVFPICPGAHVPCAGKNVKKLGPGRAYAGIAIGMAKDREIEACLLMEDMGFIHLKDTEENNLIIESIKSKIIRNLASSVLEVGKNQKVEYDEIFVGMVDVNVKVNELGCALVAAPYVTLAKNAIPDDPDKLLEITLDEWEKMVL